MRHLSRAFIFVSLFALFSIPAAAQWDVGYDEVRDMTEVTTIGTLKHSGSLQVSLNAVTVFPGRRWQNMDEIRVQLSIFYEQRNTVDEYRYVEYDSYPPYRFGWNTDLSLLGFDGDSPRGDDRSIRISTTPSNLHQERYRTPEIEEVRYWGGLEYHLSDPITYVTEEMAFMKAVSFKRAWFLFTKDHIKMSVGTIDSGYLPPRAVNKLAGSLEIVRSKLGPKQEGK